MLLLSGSASDGRVMMQSSPGIRARRGRMMMRTIIRQVLLRLALLLSLRPWSLRERGGLVSPFSSISRFLLHQVQALLGQDPHNVVYDPLHLSETFVNLVHMRVQPQHLSVQGLIRPRRPTRARCLRRGRLQHFDHVAQSQAVCRQVLRRERRDACAVVRADLRGSAMLRGPVQDGDSAIIACLAVIYSPESVF